MFQGWPEHLLRPCLSAQLSWRAAAWNPPESVAEKQHAEALHSVHSPVSLLHKRWPHRAAVSDPVLS